MISTRRQARSAKTTEIPRHTVAGLACLAFATSLGSAVLLLSFSPQSPICGPGCLDARLQEMAAEGAPMDAARYEQAKRLATGELAFSPVDTGAWLKLAALEAGGGPLNARAQDALLSSYRFTPVDAVMARWRLGFLFEHWSELTPQLRKAAVVEIQDLMISPSSIDILRQLETTIRNPSGRLACQLLIDSFSRP